MSWIPVFRSGLLVRVVAGMSKDATGITTGDIQTSEHGVELVGVLLASRFRYIRASWLQCMRHEDCAGNEEMGLACAASPSVIRGTATKEGT